MRSHSANAGLLSFRPSTQDPSSLKVSPNVIMAFATSGLDAVLIANFCPKLQQSILAICIVTAVRGSKSLQKRVLLVILRRHHGHAAEVFQEDWKEPAAVPLRVRAHRRKGLQAGGVTRSLIVLWPEAAV